MTAQPKYLSLVAALRREIDALPVGSPVPGERTLADEHGVSRMTARRALAVLEREGRLRREVGRGTFVARPAVSLPLRLTSFTEDMRARGMEPSSRVIAVDTVPAGPELASVLAIGLEDPVTCLDRVRLADGRPMAIERTRLIAALVPGLARHDLASRSLYELLEREYAIRFDSGEQTIRAGIVRQEDAELLATAAGSPALELTRTSGLGDRTVERTVSIYPGDRFELSARIAPATAPGPERRSALRVRG